MTEDKRARQAREYVDSVVELNRRHGADPNLAAEDYEEIVQEVASAFRSLRPVGTPRVKGTRTSAER